jgi:Spy/CpxP family protein refolding chaperone
MKVQKTVSLLLAAVALLALSVPMPALAQMKDMKEMKMHGPGHGQTTEMGNLDRMGEMMGRCLEHADKMGLSEDQLLKMKPLHRELQKKQVRFAADQKIAEIDLAEILEVKDFDLEKANSAVKQMAETKTAYHLEMLKAMKQMRTILTDDQFKEMKKMMAMKMDEKRSAHKMNGKHK